MHGNEDTDAACEVWLQQALSTKRRNRRTGSSPYSHVPPTADCGWPVSKQHPRVGSKKARFSKGIIEAAQQPGSENTEPQRRHGSIQRIATSPRRAVDTPPEKRRRGVAALGEGVRRQGGGSSRSSKRPESTQAAKKMSAAELAAKKLLLPFIDELSFIEIALAERGNPSGVGLAPSNTVAKDALELFQSSYLFTEGLHSLGKATGLASSKPRSVSIGKTARSSPGQLSPSSSSTRNSPARTAGTSHSLTGDMERPQNEQVASPTTHSSSLARATPGASNIYSSSTESLDSLGEKKSSLLSPRSSAMEGLQNLSKSSATTTTTAGTSYRNMGYLRSVGQENLHSSSPRSSSNTSTRPQCKSKEGCAIVAPGTSTVGGHHGGGSPTTKLDDGHASIRRAAASKGWARKTEDNPDIGSVLRRYPRFCGFMDLTSETIMGLTPKAHPPVWTLRLCEELLDECWKAQEETGSAFVRGGAKSTNRSAAQATAGASTRSTGHTAPIDNWCLAQAKDLEVLEKGDRDDNREQRLKRARRRGQRTSDQTAFASEGHPAAGGVSPTAVSDLCLPKFAASALSDRFGVREVALQAALDLLFGLETLRPTFPEVEHFSLVLRELHDSGALALALHARTLVSRLGGLRLVDVRHRWAGVLSRAPLKSEVVVLPHPSLPAVATQPWLTRRGCVTVAFLLLGQGDGTETRKANVAAIQDAKHLVAMARASSALGLNEPPPALIAKCDAARGIPIDRGQPEGLESEQQFRSSKVQVKTVSVVHSVGDEGTGDEKHGTIGSLTSPSRGKKLKNTAISSQVGRGIGKHRSFEHSTACHRNPYVPLHGFISFLGDLHMRTPQEILEKAKASGKGGGLGALETLAAAVEQERWRQELSKQLAAEARTLDALGAEVLRLECRIRSLNKDRPAEGALLATSAQAQVALTLKIAANRKQRELVETLRSEVQRADTEVAASWQNVMAPPPAETASIKRHQRNTTTSDLGRASSPPVTNKTSTVAARDASTAAVTMISTAETVTSTAAPVSPTAPLIDSSTAAVEVSSTPTTGASTEGTVASTATVNVTSTTTVPSAAVATVTPFITAGDGLTETDAADLNYILQEVDNSIIKSATNRGKSGKIISRKARGRKKHPSSTSLGSEIDHKPGNNNRSAVGFSVRNVRSADSSVQSSVFGESRSSHQGIVQGTVHGTVPGSTPLKVVPGLAARNALCTLRMYVNRLRVTKDHEENAIDIEWRKKVAERRVAAAIVAQRWMRRVWRDRAAIGAAVLKVTALRYARGKAERHAIAEEERQVLAALEVAKKRQRHLLCEKEAVANIIKSAIRREADRRYWKAKAKIQRPVIQRWRNHIRAEVQVRSLWKRRLQGFCADWKAWVERKREATAAVAKIRETWLSYGKRKKLREAVDASTAKLRRIRTHMLKAVGRETEERFTRWKRYTHFIRQVKLMGGGHVQDRLRHRLQRWKNLVRLGHIQRQQAATTLQGFARTAAAKKTIASLRKERRARELICRQMIVQIAVIHFQKHRRRMAYLAEQVDSLLKERQKTASEKVLKIWRHDSRGRRLAKTKVAAMTKRREVQTLRGAVRSWRGIASEILRQRRQKGEEEAAEALTRERSATLIQAVWRSHNARKGFAGRLRLRREAVKIQKRWKGYRVRSTFHTKAELDHGATGFQRVIRGHRVRSRYTTFFLEEALRAASTGRFERLFWLTDRWPAVVQQAPSSWYGIGEADEGVLHLACRATAHRCVELCLQRKADACAVTARGLTPMHCLALYNARTGEEHSKDEHSSYYRNPESTAALCLPPSTTTAETAAPARAQALAAAAVAAEAASPAQGGAAATAKTLLTAEDAADHDQGPPVQWEEQRKLSVEVSVRAIANMLLEAGADVGAIDGEGNTPLLTAAETGGVALCELLLARGANADARNYEGLSALFLAVLGDAPECVEVLLYAGANPNEERTDSTNALHSAAEKGVTQVMTCLLLHGAQMDATDASGRTALMYAVKANHGTAAALLCDYGANLDLTDSSGLTALHLASQDGQIDGLRELLERSVDVDARDNQGNTGLHHAAYSGKYEVAQALLESGADPNLQNARGDNPAHVAARRGNLKVVEALVMYDVRIGQRNWQEYTPFGEARMNSHTEVAEFLKASFTRLDNTPTERKNLPCTTLAEVRGQADRLDEPAWDREIEEKATGWEQTWDEDSQRFYYFRRDTWESSFGAPFKISANRVEELREGSAVAYQRKVAAVKGESLVGLSEYREAFEEDKTELDLQRAKHKAATAIQAAWRARMSRQVASHLRLNQRCAITIQREVRRFLARRHREYWARILKAVLAIQRLIRGYWARRKHRQCLLDLQRLRSERHLCRLVARVYRGHMYGRKLARVLRAKRAASSWGILDWETAVNDAGGPEHALRTFCGHDGQWEVYHLRGTQDVLFYRNRGTLEYRWDQPEEWRAQDQEDFHKREHTRIYGFSAEESRAAVLIQRVWRGKMARDHYNHLQRAQRICKGAEAAYLADPDNLRCQINYILFTHVIEKDYRRARQLYGTALRAMEARGPDVKLLLFAYAIFCLVAEETNISHITTTVERAIAAPSGANPEQPAGSPVAFTSRRNPKAFALAEAGFFRFAAYHVNDAESWHNYAACRQLVYGDFDGATECYLKAIECDPNNAKAQMNYQILMDTFPERSQGGSTFESLSAHHMLQAEDDKRRTELSLAKFLGRPEVKEAALTIERAWMRSKQAQIERFGSYLGPTARLLHEVQQEHLSLQRGSSPGTESKPQSSKRAPAWKSETSEQLRRTSTTSPSHDRCRQGSTTTASSRGRKLQDPTASSPRNRILQTSESSPDCTAGDSSVAKSSLSTITAWTTVREIIKDGDGNEYYFDDSKGETRGGVFHMGENRESSGRDKNDGGRDLPRGVRGKDDIDNASDLMVEGHSREGGQEKRGREDTEQDAGQMIPLLPSGWEAVVADDDGAVFYHHIDSGATQWEVPQQGQG